MTAYERWELPSLDEQNEAANEVEIEPVTSEEVEEIRLNAYQEGLTKGKDKGYKEGFSQGEKEGHKQGLEKGQTEGHAKGLDQGKQEGLAAGQSEIAAEVKNLSSLMSQFEHPQAQLNQQVQDSLLNVITAVSRTVIHRELQTDSSQVQALLKEGLNQLENTREQVEISVNPVDLLHVENAAEEAGATWKIAADESILPGGLKIKSGPSLVDLTSEYRFQQAILNLLGRTDWAIDLAADQANEEQKALSSLADGYQVPDASAAASDDFASPVEDQAREDQANEQPDSELDIENQEATSEEAPLVEDTSEAGPQSLDNVQSEDEGKPENNLDRQSAEQDQVAEVEDQSLENEKPEASSEPGGVASQPDENSEIEQADPSKSEPSQSEALSDEVEDDVIAQASEMPEELKQTSAVTQDDETTETTLIDETPLMDETELTAPVSEVDDTSASEPLAVEDTLESESEEVFDFDAAEQDENTTVYPENQRVSDLIEQESEVEQMESAEQEPAVVPQEVSSEAPSNDVSNTDINQGQANSEVIPTGSATPEVQSMMQPVAQGNGFEAFAWQAPQTQQAQANAQHAQMQANAATAQAQQAQMQAQQAQAQAHQAQAHAQAMNQQAQAQVMQQASYQPQYMPQQNAGYPVQPGMVPQPGYQNYPPAQAGMVQPMQAAIPQPGMMQQGVPMQGVPMQGGLMQGGVMQGSVMPNQQAQYGTYQGMPVQPVPLVPTQNSNFSAFNFSGAPQGQAPNQAQGFAPYQFPVA